MAVPKRKQTPSRTGMRRAQTMKYSTKNIVEDKKSGEYRLSHHLDLKTGMYKGRQVLDPKEQYNIPIKCQIRLKLQLMQWVVMVHLKKLLMELF